MATVQVFPDVLLDDFAVPEFHPVSISKAEALSKKYVLSVCAATAAELFTYPIDIVKTRLQVQSEIMARGQLQATPRSLFGLTWGKSVKLYKHSFIRLCHSFHSM